MASVSQVDKSFDSCMAIFFTATKVIRELPQHNTYHEYYALRNRHYFPKFHNLTFELRDLSLTSSDNASVFFIYNDSIKFIIPFFDSEHYRAFFLHDRDSSYLKQYPTFGTGFGRLVTTLKLEQFDEVLQFSNILMGVLNAKIIMSEGDYRAAEIILREKRATTDSLCAKSLNRVLGDFQNFSQKGAVCYTDGLVVYHLLKRRGLEFGNLKS